VKGIKEKSNWGSTEKVQGIKIEGSGHTEKSLEDEELPLQGGTRRRQRGLGEGGSSVISMATGWR